MRRWESQRSNVETPFTLIGNDPFYGIGIGCDFGKFYGVTLGVDRYQVGDEDHDRVMLIFELRCAALTLTRWQARGSWQAGASAGPHTGGKP